MNFGINYQPLTERVYAGRLNKALTAFLDKQDVTNQAVAAVAEYVLAKYPEGMSLRKPDGTGWEIDVKGL